MMEFTRKEARVVRILFFIIFCSTLSVGQNNQRFVNLLYQMASLNNLNSPALTQNLQLFLQSQPLSNQPVGSTFPKCTINVPICFRTKCGSNIANAESSEAACLRDPSCCFDKDLKLYKQFYGSSYMNGAPLCYHGITSLSYLQLARKTNPWSPFYHVSLLRLFETAHNNSIYRILNSACSFTGFPGLFSNRLLNGPACGWKGITKLECVLRECCYNDNSRTCHYPRNYLRAVGNELPYPELLASDAADAECPKAHVTTAASNVFKRIPCQHSGNTIAANSAAQCMMNKCCFDWAAAIPNRNPLNPFPAVHSPGINNLSPGQGNLPLLLAGLPAARSGNGANTMLAHLLSGSRFIQPPSLAPNQNQSPIYTCPYNFVRNPGLPDLGDRLQGCCEQTFCFHRKALSNANLARLSNMNTAPPFPGTGSIGSRSLVTNFNNLNLDTEHQARTPVNNPPTTTAGSFTSSRPSASTASPGTIRYIAAWQAWSEWTSCSKTCGTGRRDRSRICKYDSDTRAPDHFCAGEHLGIRTCNMGECPPKSRSWGEWQTWESCSAQCGAGQRQRRRSCYYGRTRLDAYLCEGNDVMQEQCVGAVCASWGPWTTYGSCRADCGGTGVQIYSRVCMDRNRPVNASACAGKAVLAQNCSRKSCIVLTEWGNWESCSHTCGTGVQQRRRLCLQNGLQVNQSACNGTFVENQPCVRGLCPGSVTSMSWAVWASWSSWSACPVTCGEGFRTRERRCLYKGNRNVALNSLVCENISKNSKAVQRRNCTSGLCSQRSVSYAWTAWTALSDCSVTCGNGRRTRQRACMSQNRMVNARYCEGSDVDIYACSSTPTCGNWMHVSQWSNCSVTCGSGIRTRIRCRSIDGTSCLENSFRFDEKRCILATPCS